MTAESETPVQDASPARTLWPWILAGAGYGVLLRLVFGFLPNSISSNGVMSVAFLLGAPIVAGAITVHAARGENRSFWFLIFGPWVTVGLMLVGCAITLLEGSICIALLSPLFLACGSIGGLLMAAAQKISKFHGTNLAAFAVLPFALLAGEEYSPLAERELEIRQSVIINASASRVWREIVDARNIHADELPLSIAHLIGVPRPVEGINKVTPDGEIRFSKWERGVNFKGVVTERENDKTIHWKYLFDAHSFPKESMDEHVAIGGRFFDLNDTRFNLQELAPNRTSLEIVAHYRVSSSINFYAIPAARFLGRDFVNTILHLYKGRSEDASSH